jgi:hypothetical protein
VERRGGDVVQARARRWREVARAELPTAVPRRRKGKNSAAALRWSSGEIGWSNSCARMRWS